MDIQKFKTRFDRSLKRFLDRKIRAQRSHTSDPRILESVSYAQKLLFAGGKRIRPYMAFLSYQAAGGGRDAAAIDTFVALEIFHMFALIHDDIMDHGMLRHGVATAHRRFGEAQAILLGDLLFAWSAERIAGTACEAIFHRMAEEVIIGQMIDVEVMARSRVSDRLLHDKMRLKTANYTFVRPMQMGIAFARNAKRKTQNLMKFSEQFGGPLGIGFQIQDDLFDLTLTARQLGKAPFSDLRDGQHTLFTQHVPQKYLKPFWKKKLTEKDRPRVRRIFQESGALEYGTREMERCFAKAERAVEEADLPKMKVEPFREVVRYIRTRRA